jgi:hypothetical protein
MAPTTTATTLLIAVLSIGASACSLPPRLVPDAALPDGGGADLPSDGPGGDPLPSTDVPSPDAAVPDVPGPDPAITDGPTAEAPGADALGTGILSGVRTTELPGMVDLTATGTLDWVHWGLNGDVASVNRKDGVPPQIGNAVPTTTGSIMSINCCIDHFSWTDGSPTAEADMVQGGIYIDTPTAAGDMWELVVQASQTPRKLRLYLGGYCADNQLVAELSDGSAPRFVSEVQITAGGRDVSLYTITFQAATAGATLRVRFSMTQNHCTTGDLGELWLGAAALSD